MKQVLILVINIKIHIKLDNLIKIVNKYFLKILIIYFIELFLFVNRIYLILLIININRIYDDKLETSNLKLFIEIDIEWS